MRTIISGKVTEQDIADADLFGITPTSYVTNGKSTPPVSNLMTEVMPICPKLPEAGEKQRDWTMCLNADALIVAGGNDHLVQCARRFNLLIYEV